MTQDMQCSEEEQKLMVQYGITHEKKSVYLWVANCHFANDIKELMVATYGKSYYSRVHERCLFPTF